MKGSSIKFLKNVALVAIIVVFYVIFPDMLLYFTYFIIDREPGDPSSESTVGAHLEGGDWEESVLLRHFVVRYAAPPIPSGRKNPVGTNSGAIAGHDHELKRELIQSQVVDGDEQVSDEDLRRKYVGMQEELVDNRKMLSGGNREQVDDGVEPSRRGCPAGGILTVQDGGRLGNKIWEYAAVWGLAHSLPTLGKAPYVPRSLLDSLGKVFQSLSLPALESVTQHCGIGDTLSEVAPVKRWRLTPMDAIPGRYPRGTHLLLHKWIVFPEPILSALGSAGSAEFQFRPELREAVQTRLHETRALFVKSLRPENSARRIAFVGVHVRRTDFATWLPRVFNRTLAGTAYFLAAMDYFRRERAGDLGTPIFLLASDDVEWCRRHLLTSSDVFLASKSPGFDLALLAACNHSIIDYGTFGMWGALMAGGETVSLTTDPHLKNVLSRARGWKFF